MGQYPSIDRDDFFNNFHTNKLTTIMKKDQEIAKLRLENFFTHTIYIFIIIFILSIKSLI